MGRLLTKIMVRYRRWVLQSISWIDFYLNDLSVISSHYKLMYLWMLTYTLFHSILWIKTCFLAYPFMRLSTPIVFVWFIGISGMHGIFFFLSICLSNKKRRAMDKAHGIDMKTIGNGSGSSGYGGVDGCGCGDSCGGDGDGGDGGDGCGNDDGWL